jgi:hypothetical protein
VSRGEASPGRLGSREVGKRRSGDGVVPREVGGG